MRTRPIVVAGLLGVVMLALGALLVGRLLPAEGSDDPVEPVILTPAGAVSSSGGPSPTPAPSAPTTEPTARPPASEAPEPVRPSPRPVDEDDDDDDDPDDPDDPDDRSDDDD